ncbi:SH2 domain-containing protein 6 [Microcaecilia unicolor]|uniref:SH2 domain-containing protein 6 n=1 Tax=Microcaecilia unicolor TaxID=1415580 RepID=A0A6P7XSE8_9AMPH|nr:SH2 domain-containing protein 6 [Microcaecilia unicolor]
MNIASEQDKDLLVFFVLVLVQFLSSEKHQQEWEGEGFEFSSCAFSSSSRFQPPPLPPPRHESSRDEEVEEETEDTYEAPPCVMSKLIPLQKLEDEEIYSDGSSSRGNPVSQNRLPAKRPVKMSLSLNTALNESSRGSHPGHGTRSSKFQRGGMRPPLPPTDRRLSLPISALYPQPESLLKPIYRTEDDLYLMPVPDQDESQDDIYLECEPVTRAPELNKAYHSLTSVPGPKPKPPPPPLKLPKPKLPFIPVKHISAVPLNSRSTCQPGTKPQVVTPENTSEDASVVNKAWYGGHCTRNAAESALLKVSKDGSYMVRHSSGLGSSKQPYTLVVLYKGYVYNIPIRYVASSQSYALGKEGKAYEELFDSISSIIQHYQDHPLVLIDSQNASKEQTILLCPVQP